MHILSHPLVCVMKISMERVVCGLVEFVVFLISFAMSCSI